MAKKKAEGTDTVRPQDQRKQLMNAKLKSLGLGTNCVKRGQELNDTTTFLSTGSDLINTILGPKLGLARGKLIEFCGESGSGKTHLACQIIAEANKLGERGAVFNIENSFYPPRAKALGVAVDDDDLFELVEDMGSAENYGEMLKFMVESGDYAVIVVDSVSALVPAAELSRNLEQTPIIGLHARFMKRLLVEIHPLAAKTNTMVILINQFYTGFDAMGRPKKQPTGGASMDYFTSQRLWINKKGGAEGKVARKGDDGKDEIIGGKSRIVVQKNRYGTPGLECLFTIYFTDVDTDPISEFLYIAKSSKDEWIREVYKVFKYENPDTGEVIENKDPKEFIRMLQAEPAPEKMPRGVTATNAFEWIANRIKTTPKEIHAINNMLNGISALSAENRPEDEAVYEPSIEEIMAMVEDDEE